MIWRVDVQGEGWILVDSVSRSGARIMAAQLGYTPTAARQATYEEADDDTKHVYKAVFNTNPADPKLLNLKDQRK